MDRKGDLDRFYDLLNELKSKVGGPRYLRNSDAKMKWPSQGVYFFFEEGEYRQASDELRVVRVGTHAVTRGAKTTLWDRLRTHRGFLGGSFMGGGNHRGSIFRLHVGTAILNRESRSELVSGWCEGYTAARAVREREHGTEVKVSAHIREMPFLWLEVIDEPEPNNLRARIERNSITLLSNFEKLGSDLAIDPPSSTWLGLRCAKAHIRQSGLWNVKHVNKGSYDPLFLDDLEQLIEDFQV